MPSFLNKTLGLAFSSGKKQKASAGINYSSGGLTKVFSESPLSWLHTP
jgi:hypothetical protein